MTSEELDRSAPGLGGALEKKANARAGSEEGPSEDPMAS
jgi:hypothetical protein